MSSTDDNNLRPENGNGREEEEFGPPTTEQLNMRCTGVKRLLKEAMELRHPNEMFCAKPMEDNLFEWHFTVRGPPDSAYADGVYHGRIVLPADYPMKPPNLILLTPNGRFETNKKICLSISGYHPETWLPSWSIRTALLALIGFMPSHSAGALGSLECSREERRRMAIKSLDWRCDACGVTMRDALPPLGSTGRTEHLLEEVRGAAISSKRASSESMKNATKSTPSPIVSTAELATELAGTTTNNPLVSANQPLSTTSATNPLQPAVPPTQTSVSPSAIRSISSLRAQLESPLFWIVVLSAFLFALLFRRILVGNASEIADFDPGNTL